MTQPRDIGGRSRSRSRTWNGIRVRESSQVEPSVEDVLLRSAADHGNAYEISRTRAATNAAAISRTFYYYL